jgi:hypothetical protein
MNSMHPKHEIIRCERCGAAFECKANSFTKCQCSVVPLTLNETQYISENYEGCLCAGCLMEVKKEYEPELNEMNLSLIEQIQIGLREVKEIREGKLPGYTMRDLFNE